MSMELQIINQLCSMVDREFKNRVIEIEESASDANDRELHSYARELRQAAKELEVFRFKIDSVFNAVFIDTLEQMEMGRQAPPQVTKVETIATENVSVELPEIAPRHRTVETSAQWWRKPIDVAIIQVTYVWAVLFRHDSAELDKAYAQAERMLNGVTLMACLGDPLALAGFCLVPPIRSALIGACTKQSEAVEMLDRETPQLLFTSELLEQGYGIDLIRNAKSRNGDVICLLFVRREKEDVVEEAMNAGANGCIFVSSLGGCGDSDFMQALKTTLSGGLYFPPSVRNAVKKELSPPPPWEKELTLREMEVLRLVCAGMNNDEIAADLNVSVPTVKTHLRAVYSKVGVSERTKLLVKALKAGTIQ